MLPTTNAQDKQFTGTLLKVTLSMNIFIMVLISKSDIKTILVISVFLLE